MHQPHDIHSFPTRRSSDLTPKAFLQALTLNYARDLLRSSTSVLDTAYEVGLSGPGRPHRRYRARLSMSAKGLRSEEHTSELQSLRHLVCRLLLEKKKKKNT